MNDSRLPLDGVRILAFTQLGAGPFGMMMLSDLGAEVVKVEHPGTRGDEARTVGPFADPAAHDGLYYQAFNRGTRSLTLDVASAEGRALLRRLVPRFDAVFNNLRGDLTARLGLDYASLRDANPRLVCCSLSGFGRTGPRASEPAYDYLLQAYAGFSVAEALADEQAVAREMVVELEHPMFGALREIGCPIKVDDLAPRYEPGASLGADTDAILAEVGVGAAEAAALRTRGVV